MGKVLYRKYRSRSLDEIVGQDHVVSILKRALEKDSIGHAYLLTGIRGTGKTSIARILAAEINQIPYADSGNSLDIIEIDAASNNSVEDVRDLREKARIAPTSARKKVYIIDEVHMLSKSAFNALLKTLEEPPQHVVFILATTDVEKLPATILSRVQRFNLHPVGTTQLSSHLRHIADSEKIIIDDAALEIIARHGNGSFRDSISILDQVKHSADGSITRTHVESLLGLVASDQVIGLLNLYRSGSIAEIVTYVNALEQSGTPASTLISQLILESKHRIVEEPDLLPLLDRLVDAGKSHWPDVKLLAALCANSQPAPTRRTPKVIPQLESKPTKAVATKPTVPAEPKKVAEKTTKSVAKPKPSAPKKPAGNLVDFPWIKFIESIKETSMGAYSVLAKCGYDFDGTTLFIYAGKDFAKKQLDKSLPALAAAASNSSGVSEVTIEVLPSAKELEDSQMAAVVAMMGGGEEVDING